jgi:hypothetical protein
MDNVEVHVVVTEAADAIKKSCASVGAGLALLKDDNTIEMILTYETPSQVGAKKQHLASAKSARRKLEKKVELNLGRLQTQFDEVAKVTAGMPTKLKEKYRSEIEAESLAWSEWLSEMSERLDAASTSDDPVAEVALLVAEIEQKEIP